MSKCPPCTLEFSRGRGTGVAEAIGNWGFSNEVVSPGHELYRMDCLLRRMEELKTPPPCPPPCCPPPPCPEVCMCMEHTPPECRPTWMHWERCPMITFCSVATTLLTSDKKVIARDAAYPVLDRNFRLQGNDKWYKLGPLCCPQPSCPLPSCPVPCCPVPCCPLPCCP